MSDGAEAAAMRPAPGHDSLWRALRARDESVLGQLRALIVRVATPLFWRSGVASTDVDDLVDLTVESVWRYAGDPRREPTNLIGFLKWRSRAVLKEHWQQLSHSAELAPDELVGRSVDPWSAVVASELRNAAEECMKRIPEKVRTVFELWFEQGLTRPQIATRLRRPPETVSTHLFHARRFLWDCLVGKGLVS